MRIVRPVTIVWPAPSLGAAAEDAHVLKRWLSGELQIIFVSPEALEIYAPLLAQVSVSEQASKHASMQACRHAGRQASMHAL